ncbi:restriction endonuclease [Chloroflexia bacterium SDU3-3]|nr:restriction endonuclease [Chloroflexia bacterium SDU3-3]
MGVDVTQQSEPQGGARARLQLGDILPYLRQGFASLDWRMVALIGVGAGLLMPIVITSADILQLFAGIVPVGAGLIIGRRVKGYYGLHGFMMGLVSAIIGLATLYVLLFFTPVGASMEQRAITQGTPAPLATPESQFVQFSGFVSVALLIFCSFGASMAGRSEERQRLVRAEIDARGGQLERAPAVREPSDISGMSLPQFGSYVNSIWKKQGFSFKNYQFTDKDKHLDLWMEHEEELWHLRLTVADKVGPGTVEGLYQEMKREGCKKGVVVASTTFLPTASKSAKDRPIVLIDGVTLYEMAEK